MAYSYSSPLPPGYDLHRQQLFYRSMTPASSTADELDHPLQYSRNEFVPTHPSQVTPVYYHHTPPYPPSTPLLKSEYAYMPINMADIPYNPSMEMTKSEYPDKEAYVDHTGLRSDGRIEMDQEEVDAIIRNKRKLRDPKACYACHRRKVKCDRNLPCDSCVKRDHPELCSYERPTKKRRIALSSAVPQPDGAVSDNNESSSNVGLNITVSKEQWDRLNGELAQLKRQLNGNQSAIIGNSNGNGIATEDNGSSEPTSRSDDEVQEGVHAPSTQMGTMHLGSRSLLAYMIGDRSQSTQDAAKSLLEANILPNLGLDNENATYPFVDLWSSDSSMQDVNGLCSAIPDDELCREFWTSYRDMPSVIYPVVSDKPAFEETLNRMLKMRAQIVNQGLNLDPTHPYGISLPWLALLFAVLASGSQSTGRSAKERELTSQVYICCSYQALRMSNFLSHPVVETIQALLIIGNALSYNMNPGVSYILLGMTLRSAFSMGLHVNSHNFSEKENYLRQRIWWALAWQDSHFSVSYDRPSSSIMCSPDIPYAKDSGPGNRNYVESMSAIIKLTQEILRHRSLNTRSAMSWPMIQKYRDEVHRIWEDAKPRMRSRTLCHSMEHNLERLALQLHCSYMISEICRPTLKEDPHTHGTSHSVSIKSPIASPGSKRKSSIGSANSPSTPGDPQSIANLRSECIKYLQKTVDTYVEIQTVNVFAGRSWIGIQRAISAAFLLGILPETRQEPAVIRLLTNLERCIEKSSHQDVGFPHDCNADQIDTPILQNGRQGTNVNGTRQPGDSDSPNWVRQITKSLGALSKLNATLANGKTGAMTGSTAGTPLSQQHRLSPAQQYQHSSRHSSPMTGMFSNSPLLSPDGANSMNSAPPQHHHMVTSMPVQGVPTSYQPQPHYAIGQSLGRHQQQQQQNLSSSMIQMPSTIGNITPDSTGSANTGGNSGNDWNYGNLQERAYDFIQPGLWG